MKKDNAILRITGGEPLYDEETRSKTVAILDAAKDYKKIVLCTNGIFLKEAYEANSEEWEAVRSKLLLKISLDTLNPEYFRKISQRKDAKELLASVIENINFAHGKGFNIELNVVATKENVHEANDILKIFDFAKNID